MSENQLVKRTSKVIILPSRGSPVRTSKTIWIFGKPTESVKKSWTDQEQCRVSTLDSASRSPSSIDAALHDSLADANLDGPNPHGPSDIDPAAAKRTRKYAKRLAKAEIQPIPLKDRPILTFKEAAALYPASEQALRRLARAAEQYQKYPKAGLASNGFEVCIVRHAGSRYVFLHAGRLAQWFSTSHAHPSPLLPSTVKAPS